MHKKQATPPPPPSQNYCVVEQRWNTEWEQRVAKHKAGQLRRVNGWLAGICNWSRCLLFCRLM